MLFIICCWLITGINLVIIISGIKDILRIRRENKMLKEFLELISQAHDRRDVIAMKEYVQKYRGQIGGDSLILQWEEIIELAESNERMRKLYE